MKCRSDATSFPFCLISVSSHHSHSLPPEYFPRCGVLVALAFAQGWNNPWHFALRPVAETRTNHLSLSKSAFPADSGTAHRHARKTYFSFQPLCTGSPLTSLSNNFHSTSPAAAHKRSHVHKLHPVKVWRKPRSRWIVGNEVRLQSFLFSCLFHRRLEACQEAVCDYTSGITEHWIEASYEFLLCILQRDLIKWQHIPCNRMMDNKRWKTVVGKYMTDNPTTVNLL